MPGGSVGICMTSTDTPHHIHYGVRYRSGDPNLAGIMYFAFLFICSDIPVFSLSIGNWHSVGTGGNSLAEHIAVMTRGFGHYSHVIAFIHQFNLCIGRLVPTLLHCGFSNRTLLVGLLLTSTRISTCSFPVISVSDKRLSH